jgi:hypothetical protein
VSGSENGGDVDCDTKVHYLDRSAVVMTVRFKEGTVYFASRDFNINALGG